MPTTLRDVLSDTMLLTAAPFLPFVPSRPGASLAWNYPNDAAPGATAPAAPTAGPDYRDIFDPDGSRARAAAGRVEDRVEDRVARATGWAFRFAFDAAGGARVTHLGYRWRWHGNTQMQHGICETVQWGAVRVRATAADAWSDLPLRPEFLLGHYVHDHHRARDAYGNAVYAYIGEPPSGAWTTDVRRNATFRHPTVIEAGIQLVFAYERTRDGWRPLPADVRGSGDDRAMRLDDFGPNAWLLAPSGVPVPARAPGATTHVEVPLVPVRVLVCVSFAVCAIRADFEPLGSMDAVRMYPLVMVRPNSALHEVQANVTVLRPATSDMAQHMPQEMAREMNFVLATDRNGQELSAFVPPFWSSIFDYYFIPEDSPGQVTTFAALHHSLDGAGRIAAGPAARARDLGAHFGHPLRLQQEWSFDAHSGADFFTGRLPTTVHKTAGQGEFDSVHLAPRMLLPRANEPTLRVAMAPVCAHDCLHTHFRWGDQMPPTSGISGWDRDGACAGGPGAPLAARNQDVLITMREARGFDYQAICRGPITAGRWQVIYHHGSAYGIAVHDSASSAVRNLNPAEFAGTLSNIPPGVATVLGLAPGGGWPGFYFLLRYMRARRSRYDDVVEYRERLTFPNGLDELREVQLRPQP